jgi:hypothetical protein
MTRINNINQMMMVNFDVMLVLVTLHMLSSRQLVRASSSDVDPGAVILVLLIMGPKIAFILWAIAWTITWALQAFSLVLPAVTQGVGAAYLAYVMIQGVRLFVRDRKYYIAMNPKYKQLSDKRLKRSRPSGWTDYFFGKPVHIVRNLKMNGLIGGWKHRNDNFAKY